MKTIELFSGTKSFSKVASARGHSTFTVDNDPSLEPDLIADLSKFFHYAKPVDIIWASMPCTTFSVASIGKHWGGGFRAYAPKTEAAKLGMELVKNTLDIIQKKNPKFWFMENPRGVLRKLDFMDTTTLSKRMGCLVYRHTIWYCRYGDKRAKPTDIWTNVPESIWTPRPPCKNGNPDHEAAPRGARTGTQGLKGATARGAIPAALFDEIFNALT